MKRNQSEIIIQKLDIIEEDLPKMKAEEIKKAITEIKEILCSDRRLSSDDMLALYETGKEKRKNKLINLEVLKKELNIELV